MNRLEGFAQGCPRQRTPLGIPADGSELLGLHCVHGLHDDRRAMHPQEFVTDIVDDPVTHFFRHNHLDTYLDLRVGSTIDAPTPDAATGDYGVTRCPQFDEALHNHFL